MVYAVNWFTSTPGCAAACKEDIKKVKSNIELRVRIKK
jgi:hypothetical protein